MLSSFSFVLISFTLVLSDNDASQKSKAVKELMRSSGIDYAFYSAYVAKLTNAVDNSFNGVLRTNMNEEVGDLKLEGAPTTSEKLQVMGAAQARIGPVVVRSFLTRTGLIGNEDPVQIVSRLFSEGLHPSPQFLPLHLSQLQSYLDYHIINKLEIPIDDSSIADRLQGPFFNMIRHYRTLQLNLIRSGH